MRARSPRSSRCSTFVDQIRRFDNAEVTLVQLVGLTLLNVPEALYRILPLMVILATLALFLSLARTSRAGRDPRRRTLGAARARRAGRGGGRGRGVRRRGPQPDRRRHLATLRDAVGPLFRAGLAILSISREGLWLRQGGAEGQTVIRAARANLDGTELRDVTFIGFGDDGAPVFRIEADEARLKARRLES